MVGGECHQNQALLLPAAQSPGIVYPVSIGSCSADSTTAAECRYPDREERSEYLTADQYYAGYIASIGECAMLNDLPAIQYLIFKQTHLRGESVSLKAYVVGLRLPRKQPPLFQSEYIPAAVYENKYCVHMCMPAPEPH